MPVRAAQRSHSFSIELTVMAWGSLYDIWPVVDLWYHINTFQQTGLQQVLTVELLYKPVPGDLVSERPGSLRGRRFQKLLDYFMDLAVAGVEVGATPLQMNAAFLRRCAWQDHMEASRRAAGL